MFAIIGGSSLFTSNIFENWEERKIETPFGRVLLKIADRAIFLQRHGEDLLPPHRINHKANIWALKEMKVEKIFAINSTGSLKKSLKPGSFLVPDDFFCPWMIPTFFDRELKFSIPRFDPRVIEIIYDVAKETGMKVKKGGIYVQTLGPRFETLSEIKFFKKVGDVIGMTLASEATLSIECGIPYGSLCSIDNYCHGLGEKVLTIEEVKKAQRESLAQIERFIENLLRRGGE
ncbi:MAG: MTAP family purine nucleoside phosphorylase [Desulfobacterota bacterium]|nr:MTAP family purine nucleoside phosphorylase [Thermodesulfobacteriota bacterium]MDW8002035.1 MTAP family purine nucleoside phosphorylase [Deltaproteobacteria bacterium]